MTGSGLRFAGIWEENVEGWEWSSYRGLTSQQFSDRQQEMTQNGKYLVDFEGYETSSGIRYAGIWYENVQNVESVFHRDLTRTAYQDQIDALQSDYRVVDFESYTVGGDQRYAAIWERNLFDHASVVRSDRSEIEFANYWRLYRDQGYRIIDFERYETPNGTRYAGVWTENSPRYRWEHKGTINGLAENFRAANGIPGLSVAIVEDGKLVYQRGFGMAESDRQKEAHGESVYLIASVAKVIGGTLAAKLEAEGQLRDGTSVSLNLSNTTTSYLNIPASGHTHTVRQLLAHLGCIWHYSGPTPGGHFNTAQDALEDMWNNPPMSGCTIGTNWNYSTHAFTFIGAVLEDVTGRPIARLVE
jgi:hypothetical protein